MLQLLVAVLWPLISSAESEFVRVRPGADLFSNPDMVADPGARSSMPWNSIRQHCKTTGVARGERLFELDGVTSVKLDRRAEGCGRYFRAFDKTPQIVFLKSEDVTDDSRDDVTEAGSTDPGCDTCHDRADPNHDIVAAALRGMKSNGWGERANEDKTDEELEQLIACYGEEHYPKYDRFYRKLFNLAGRTFQVRYEPNEGGAVAAVLKPSDLDPKNGTRPFWVRADAKALKCVGLRESQWNPLAVSPTGGLGIGQQTEVNVTHMRCLLEGCVDDEGRKIAARPWAQQVWKAYFQRARGEFTPAEFKELTTNPKTKRPCSERMSDPDVDPACALNSIAAMALYQIDAELTIRQASAAFKDSATEDFSGKARFQKVVLTANTNNAGVGTTRRAVRSGPATEWLKAAATFSKDPKRNQEIRDNAEVLRKCLKHGNFETPWKKKPGEKDRDCTKPRPKK